jgi:phage terminase large subunit GpA-like protein
MPPPELTVSQWADAERRLSSESSAEPGAWRTDRAPYQRGMMDAISDTEVREVWVMKSAQVGATEIINNILGFHIHHDPAPMLLVQPTLEMAEAWSKDRLAPMIRDTPALRDRIADPKARDSGNTLLHKKFAGGHLTVAGANSPAGLASRPVRVVLFDEVDRYPASAGSEGDPVSLGRKRTTTFWNRKVIAVSTPTIKGISRIEAGFESGDQRFYEVPCPGCGTFQRLVWTQVHWEDGQPETARYVCAHCATAIGEGDKPAMLMAGRWTASKPFHGVASFHISELYSPWSTWAEMARAFLEAKRLPETLQTWINTALGETWEDSGDAVKPEGLLARREAYTDASLPSGVLLLTRGTDVQDDRLESTLWGWGRDGEAWRIRHDVIRGDPGQAALWADHDELLKLRHRTDDGRELVCEAVAVDSGGHHTEQVYNYCAARKRFRVFAIKGIPGARPAWPRKASRGGKKRLDVWPIGVDTIKDVVAGRLKRVLQPGPGFLHLDATADDVAVEQLASEVQVYAVVKGRKVRVWRPRRSGVRNEQFDCLVYAYAAMVGRGGQELVDRRTSAEVAAPQQELTVAEATPPEQQTQNRRTRQPPPRRGGGWMGRLR